MFSSQPLISYPQEENGFILLSDTTLYKNQNTKQHIIWVAKHCKSVYKRRVILDRQATNVMRPLFSAGYYLEEIVDSGTGKKTP